MNLSANETSINTTANTSNKSSCNAASNNATTNASTMTISNTVFRMMSLTTVGHIHDSATVASVSVVGHVLDPAIRQRHGVLALDVASLVPGPGLAEVSVVLVIVDTVGEVERVRLVIVLVASTVTSVDHSIRSRSSSSETSERETSQAEKTLQHCHSTIFLLSLIT